MAAAGRSHLPVVLAAGRVACADPDFNMRGVQYDDENVTRC